VKKIYINGKFFGQRVTGTQRYARELLHQFDHLLSADSSLAMEVLVPPGVTSIPHYRNLSVRVVGRLSGVKWEQIELPRHCRNQLLFTPCGGAPLLHRRNVVTIHDAAVIAAPSGYSLLYRNWYKNVCRVIARTAEHIITDSQFSKSELGQWYGANARKVSVIYLGSEHLDHIEADASVLARLGVTKKYVLAVSSHNPNKNLSRIVKAVDRLRKADIDLVIAGGWDSRIYGNGGHIPSAIRVTGFVNDAELKALYQHASCFVFPSLYEGFGLPPMEAIANGCPVVVSRAGALPEIFDGAAVFCEPYDPENIAAAIERTLTAPLLTVEGSKSFAKRFSWELCARKTLEIITRL
jgi:glycosyltransferase involved in cell wall biosynthesis